MLDAAEAQLLRRLLAEQELASLATLHHGEPAVSMVPYALLDGRHDADGTPALLLHVSRLAPHTADLLATPAVGLLVMAPRTPQDNPLALPRLSLQGRALPCRPEDPAYPAARAAYLARLPEAEPMFGFGDFTLLRVVPTRARFVAGFGRAMALGPAQLAQVLTGA